MSDSEKMGRCRREVDECRGSPSELKIADAIDCLAADVAVIEAKVNDIMPEDVRHFVESEKAWVALVTEQRDAAIRERNAANQQRADTVRRLVQAQAEVAQLRASRDVANRLFGAEQAEVERLKAELAARQADGNSPGIPDSSPPAPQPAAPPAGWLTDRERHVLLSLLCERPRDPTLGWQDYDGVVRAILARAGSPPVVEVPVLRQPGPMTIREKQIHVAYRDALDKAGVSWKEVPRE